MIRGLMAAGILGAGLLLPGCLVIGTTELRIVFSESGGAAVTMKFTDIRSDAANDSVRLRDYGIMMESIGGPGVKDIERRQRLTVTGHRFTTAGDTLLNAEVNYYVYRAEDVEGLRYADNQISVVVSQDREIVGTNGAVTIAGPRVRVITWPGDARDIWYSIREKNLPRSVSLAAQFLAYGDPSDTTSRTGE
jgi:hypothetical protein